MIKCKFEDDGHCCNCGATQYMIECKQPCETIFPMTNADRIRAMSDEELVDKFGWHCLCDFVELKTADSCDAKGSCKNCLLEWLKQPAEGDVNNG